MEYSWEVLNIQPSPLPPNWQKMFLCRIFWWNIFHFDNCWTLHKYVLNIFPVFKKLDEDLMKYYLLPDYDNKVLLWLMKTFHPEEQLILIYLLVFPNFYYFQTMKDLCLVLDSELFSPIVFPLFSLNPDILSGLLLCCWAAVAVGSMLRPYLQRRRGGIPPLWRCKVSHVKLLLQSHSFYTAQPSQLWWYQESFLVSWGSFIYTSKCFKVSLKYYLYINL